MEADSTEAGRFELARRLLDGVAFDRAFLVGSAPPEFVAWLGRGGAEIVSGEPILEQPYPDQAFDLIVAAGWVDQVEAAPRAVVELKRLTSRHLVLVVRSGTPARVRYSPPNGTQVVQQVFDEERLSGLITGAGLEVRRIVTSGEAQSFLSKVLPWKAPTKIKSVEAVGGLLGALAERPF